MSFIDEFQADLEALPNILQKRYALMRDLDKSLQEIVRQNEQRCEQEIEDIKRGVRAENIRFSDEALDEQKHGIRIADEKVALAIQTYDLVDSHIQQLDQYLKMSDDELRRERENAATASPVPSPNSTTKFGRSNESGRGGRKNYSNMKQILESREMDCVFLKKGSGILILGMIIPRKETRLATAAAAAAAATEVAAAAAENPTGMELDLPVDPNEPTYCLCNQVSYGEMVACDNPNCKIEWFHFGCVGLKEQPRGKWYCPDCAALKNRRKGRSR